MSDFHPGSYRYYHMEIKFAGEGAKFPPQGVIWINERRPPSIISAPIPQLHDTHIEQTASRFVRYDPVGECIYCGAFDALTKEHIVAEGLGGTLMLPKAVCPLCRKKTNEQGVLQTTLWAARHQLGIRMKKRKRDLSKGFPFLGPEGPLRRTLESHPTILLLPVFQPPSELVGSTRPDRSFSGLWWRSLNVDLNALAREGLHGFAPTWVDSVRFSQFLAKIAHSYAMATMRGKFTPILNEFILTEFANDDDVPSEMYRYIGGDITQFPPSSWLHELGHTIVSLGSTGRPHLLVSVRLFSSLGAPTYYVAVGTIADDVALRMHGKHSIAFQQ